MHDEHISYRQMLFNPLDFSVNSFLSFFLPHYSLGFEMPSLICKYLNRDLPIKEKKRKEKIVILSMFIRMII